MLNKKIISFLLLITLLLSACSNTATNNVSTSANEEVEYQPIKLAGLSGPTSMGLAKLLTDNNNGSSKLKYDFTIAGAADQIAPLLTKGDLDMACVPANLASILYNKTNGKIKVLAINTLGVIYVVDRNKSINSLADLKGKTVYISGKGQTPEYLMRYLLSKSGIDPDNDVNFQFKSEHAEIVSVLKDDAEAVAVLPEPFITVAKSQINDLNVAISTTDEYNKINNSTLITGVLVANSNFIDNNKQLVNEFLDEYKSSINYVLKNTNEAAKMIGDLNIFKEEIAKKALPKCNIHFESGNEMKKAISTYLSILFEQDPSSVGGKLPNDDFYYVK